VGGLAYGMLSKIADRFYDLVVQSDVGLVDVAWGLKDERTSAVVEAHQPAENGTQVGRG